MDILLIELGALFMLYAWRIAGTQDSKADLLHMRMRHMRQARVRKASRHMPSRNH